ncbi:MAG: FKBP-type peptidyl-prolyl cis-trans isomerase [Nanoarchaeota archaeon]|nr:FKBP-type peptidyl-prolyl cis-trans isomerase [Nanoarchaeota archaeon]
MENNKISKNDFVELKYTGYANGDIFDSNISEDLKKLNPNAQPIKTIIAIGQEMVVKGLDKSLEGKEIGKEYEIILSPKESFGERKRDLVKTIPLKAFTEKKVSPYPGLVLTLDDIMVKIIAVSGGRVMVDFNNPLSGKEIKYKFNITRKVSDEKEKAETLFSVLFRFIPEYEIKESVMIKGPKSMEVFVKVYSEKFKELLGKPLVLEEIKPDTKIKKSVESNEEKLENKLEENKDKQSS